MIKFSGVYKTFQDGFFHHRKITVLEDISFELQKHSTYALIGPNGSGKTTLLSCMMGLYHPSQGSIKIDGLHPSVAQARQNIGYLPENFTSYADVTAINTLMYYASLQNLKMDVSVADHWLYRMDLHKDRNRTIGSFSKGMLQRIGIIVSLMHNPKVIILDEPLSGLDPQGRMIVRKVLQNEKERGKTILISSHVLSDIEKICDHALIISKGKLKLNQNMRDACKEQNCSTIEELYIQTIGGGHHEDA